MELTFIPGIMGFGPIKKLSDGGVAGGIQSYDPKVRIIRAKEFRFDNK